MILLKCVGGRRKDGEDCTYEVTMRDPAYVVNTVKKVRGFDCPVCKKFGLKAYKKKGSA